MLKKTPNSRYNSELGVRSSMDRIRVSEALDTGSIPVGRARIPCLYGSLGQFFKAWFEFPVIKRRNAGSLWLLFLRLLFVKRSALGLLK